MSEREEEKGTPSLPAGVTGESDDGSSPNASFGDRTERHWPPQQHPTAERANSTRATLAGSDAPSDRDSDSPTDVPAPPDASQPKPGSVSTAPDASGAAIRVHFFGQTNVGLIREHNEDNFLTADFKTGLRDLDHLSEGASEAVVGATQRGTLLAVCDGMGGAAAGEVASQMAVDTLFEFFSELSEPRDRDHFAQRIVTSVEEAGARIFGAARADRTQRGMGTTATVAGLMDKVLFVGQVGDSRAYVLRSGELVQITKDQSLVNQLIEAGQLTEEEADAFEHSNIILQALGTTEDVTVDLTFLELRQGDRLMLCSDGLSGLVHQEMIKDVLAEGTDLREMCERLIEMANTGGGHDNITVICAEFEGDGLAAPEDDGVPIYQQYPLPPSSESERRFSSSRPKKVLQPAAAPPPGEPAYDPGYDDDLKSGKPAGWLLSLGLFFTGLLFIAAILFWIMSSAESKQQRQRTQGGADDSEQVDPLTEQILSGPATVRVTVTGIEGDLFIDDTEYEVPAGIRSLSVELEPGPHRFESRGGDGHALAQEIRTVRLGEPLVIGLVPLEAAEPLEAVIEAGDVQLEDVRGSDDPSPGASAEVPARTPEPGRARPEPEPAPAMRQRAEQPPVEDIPDNPFD